MRKINKSLTLFLGLPLIFVTILLVTVSRFSPMIGHAVYYCQSFITTHMIPIPNYLSSVPIGIFFIILTISLCKLFILIVKVKLLKRTLWSNATKGSRINKLIEHLKLQNKTFVIQSDESFAFCLGVRTPKIYISTELISQLSLKETEAVLRHEQYHLKNHDTFTMLIASVTHSLFPFFPLISDFIKKYRIEREIAADRFASTKLQSTAPLISALKKLLDIPPVETLSLAAIGDLDTLEPRIYALVNKQYKRKEFKLHRLMITIFSSLVIATIMTMPVYSQELRLKDHTVIMLCTDGKECMNSCASEKNLDKLYSEIPDMQKMSHQGLLKLYTPAH